MRPDVPRKAHGQTNSDVLKLLIPTHLTSPHLTSPHRPTDRPTDVQAGRMTVVDTQTQLLYFVLFMTGRPRHFIGPAAEFPLALKRGRNPKVQRRGGGPRGRTRPPFAVSAICAMTPVFVVLLVQLGFPGTVCEGTRRWRARVVFGKGRGAPSAASVRDEPLWREWTSPAEQANPQQPAARTHLSVSSPRMLSAIHHRVGASYERRCECQRGETCRNA